MKKYTQKEIEIIKKYFPIGGTKLCTKYINRSRPSIQQKAIRLGVKVYPNMGAKRKIIIEKLSDNRAIAICKHHGKTEYYTVSNRMRCIKCEAERFNEWSRKPESIHKRRKRVRKLLKTKLYKYKNRLRSVLYFYFDGIISFSKDLPYNAQELHDHLENIRLKQNNSCPLCKESYDNTNFDIEHKIPISFAKDDKELLRLFDLDNLSLMCYRCNRYVKRNRHMEY